MMRKQQRIVHLILSGVSLQEKEKCKKFKTWRRNLTTLEVRSSLRIYINRNDRNSVPILRLTGIILKLYFCILDLRSCRSAPAAESRQISCLLDRDYRSITSQSCYIFTEQEYFGKFLFDKSRIS